MDSRVLQIDDMDCGGITVGKGDLCLVGAQKNMGERGYSKQKGQVLRPTPC